MIIKINSIVNDGSRNRPEVKLKPKSNDSRLLLLLKKEYAGGKTVDEYDFDDNHITRVILKEHNIYCISFRDKYN